MTLERKVHNGNYTHIVTSNQSQTDKQEMTLDGREMYILTQETGIPCNTNHTFSDYGDLGDLLRIHAPLDNGFSHEGPVFITTTESIMCCGGGERALQALASKVKYDTTLRNYFADRQIILLHANDPFYRELGPDAVSQQAAIEKIAQAVADANGLLKQVQLPKELQSTGDGLYSLRTAYELFRATDARELTEIFNVAAPRPGPYPQVTFKK